MIADTRKSFCMSVPKNWSMPNSKNSHKTPTVMEKQNATIAKKSGHNLKENRSLRLNKSTSEKPTAATKKPFMVCSMVSQPGMSV